MNTKSNLLISTGVLAVLLAITATSNVDYHLSVALVKPGSLLGEMGTDLGNNQHFGRC